MWKGKRDKDKRLRFNRYPRLKQRDWLDQS